MKSKFEELLKNYNLLMEQPLTPAPDVGAAPDATVAPTGGPDATTPIPTPVQQPSSVGYAILVQLLLDAYKTTNIRHKDDIKFSDNIVRTPQEAYKYLEIVKRNLEPDLQQKTKETVGKGGANEKSVDSTDLINIANLALKSLFFTPKDSETGEYNEIASQVVDVNNAKQIYNQIRNAVSESE